MKEKYSGQEADRANLIRTSGRKIGSLDKPGIVHDFFVLDGKVYSLIQKGMDMKVREDGDYFEFCQALRKGQVEGFIPRNDFHLANAKEKT